MAPRPFLEQYRAYLDEGFNAQELKQAFGRIKQEHPVFDRYPTVEALRNLLSPNNKNYADKDEIMAILLRELKRTNAVYPLINLMFWDSNMLKEQRCCLGRVFARHGVPDDVVWEVVKGFDLIYQKARRQAEGSGNGRADNYHVPKMSPHPGLTYLLEKIER